ncbi:MAG: HAD-IIA family hydrolase, partial [Halanaerobiaceae bacterium]|nr:HAD-IIA family hydrolase [Halanaerobiaceae bacterium]
MKMKNLDYISCFLLDMDGTVYLGNELIKGADRFIDLLMNSKREFFFFTNNSSKNPGNYRSKLEKMGIRIPESRIITSGDLTIDYLKKESENPLVYLVGTPFLEEQFISNGIRLTRDISEKIDYLVLSFDTTLNYRKIWDAHELILRGIRYIATNPDFVCPLEGGKSMPDCGSMISLLKTSTGREPYIIGKPNTLVIDYIEKKTGLKRNEIAIVGDRLYTDIQT